MSGTPEAPRLKGKGRLPYRYMADFLGFLNGHRDRVQTVTYDDLPWGGDFDYHHNYPVEWGNWKRELGGGTRDSRVIYVLLQHDVDGLPERTMAMLREEAELGLRSNVMIFNRRVDAARLRRNGGVAFTDYPIDYGLLRGLQESGFVIGYHMNAFEQAAFDPEGAKGIFESDVAELRARGLKIGYFSPHGGVRSPDGRCNFSVEVPESLKRSIRWAHNAHSPRFDGNYSDGGIKSPKDSAKLDLRGFARGWRPGGRYRALAHPQYYHSPCVATASLADAQWYRDLMTFYESGKPPNGSVWSDVTLMR